MEEDRPAEVETSTIIVVVIMTQIYPLLGCRALMRAHVQLGH